MDICIMIKRLSFLMLLICAQISCAIANSFDVVTGKYKNLILGMSDTQVETATGIKPTRCDRCIEHEKYAYIPSTDKGAELFFFKNHLYKISFSANELSLKKVIGKLNADFKKEGSKFSSTTYLLSAKWMNRDRIARVDFGKNDNKIVAIHIVDREYICKSSTKTEQSKLQGLVADPLCDSDIK
jgi:hypothetical protein